MRWIVIQPMHPFQLQSYEDPAAASVLAVLIVGVVLISNFLVRKASGGKYGL